mmetsp:Transcript_68194/g.138334  ORF Transcript_68194/g.138334 Transcript_68194/m.138334 type:complete len:110 (+) Transcript_68194:30-359(+)
MPMTALPLDTTVTLQANVVNTNIKFTYALDINIKFTYAVDIIKLESRRRWLCGVMGFCFPKTRVRTCKSSAHPPGALGFISLSPGPRTWSWNIPVSRFGVFIGPAHGQI